MECPARLALQYKAAVLQAELNLQSVAIDLHLYAARRKRKRARRRRWWSRAWLSPGRRRQFGLYDQLMVELRREDQDAFINFMRMPPEMFDDVLQRVGPRITKQHTWMREPFEPGLKLAITLRHLASGTKYQSMRFGWRVPHNTISMIVREVIIFLLHFI